MRIDGGWFVCDDGVIRPVIRGQAQAEDGNWVQVRFLADTAADRTVLSADMLGVCERVASSLFSLVFPPLCLSSDLGLPCSV